MRADNTLPAMSLAMIQSPSPAMQVTCAAQFFNTNGIDGVLVTGGSSSTPPAILPTGTTQCSVRTGPSHLPTASGNFLHCDREPRSRFDPASARLSRNSGPETHHSQVFRATDAMWSLPSGAPNRHTPATFSCTLLTCGGPRLIHAGVTVVRTPRPTIGHVTDDKGVCSSASVGST